MSHARLLADGDRQIAQVARAEPSTRVTTTPSTAAAASSAARPLASWPRSALISSCSALISSSRRCTPATSSSVGRPDEARGIGEQLLVALQQARREFAPVTASMRRRLEPIDALADDLDQADVAGGAHVRAAAQLDRAAGLEHADDVAVLVAEEGDRAHRLGLVLGGLERPHRRVGQRLARWRARSISAISSSVTAS